MEHHARVLDTPGLAILWWRRCGSSRAAPTSAGLCCRRYGGSRPNRPALVHTNGASNLREYSLEVQFPLSRLVITTCKHFC